MNHDDQPVVLVIGSEDSRDLVADALGEQELRLEWLQDSAALGTGGGTEPAAIVVDREHVTDPATIEEWLDSGQVYPAVPLLLIAERRPDDAILQDWLRAGVWDVMAVPVDAQMLGLRIRNLMGRRDRPLPGRTWVMSNRPYGWKGLVRATEETLDLGRRHGRPLSCIAVAVRDVSTPSAAERDQLRHRLAVATREWIRGSDLMGTSDSGVLLVVLADTPLHEAQLLATRLVGTLERRLRTWGITARVDVECSAPGPDQTATEFLLQATRSAG
jgi:hypothetical protein